MLWNQKSHSTLSSRKACMNVFVSVCMVCVCISMYGVCLCNIWVHELSFKVLHMWVHLLGALSKELKWKQCPNWIVNSENTRNNKCHESSEPIYWHQKRTQCGGQMWHCPCHSLELNNTVHLQQSAPLKIMVSGLGNTVP